MCICSIVIAFVIFSYSHDRTCVSVERGSFGTTCLHTHMSHQRRAGIHHLKQVIFGPCREKTCLWGFRKIEFQTSLLSYTDWLENWNFTCSKFTYDTFHKVNNKGADQTARMRRLVCACVVRKPPKTGFLAKRAHLLYTYERYIFWTVCFLAIWYRKSDQRPEVFWFPITIL